MFRRPFRTKSNCLMKTSEKKKLLSRIKESFLQLSEDIELINIKEPMNNMKVSTYFNAVANIYVQGSTPLFIEFQNVIYPTIFILWKFPRLVYSYVTMEAVLDKLTCGADLMLPGVSRKFYGNIETVKEGDPVAVCSYENLASFAVGCSMMNGQDIAGGVRIGRAVKIVHTFGDELQKLMDDVPKLPVIVHNFELSKDFQGSGDGFHVTSFVSSENTLSEKTSSENNLCSDVDHLTLEETENHENKSVDFTMDELAEYCLLKSLLSKKLELPILVNLFYSKFMLSYVPEGYELNIKKTRYKKLSNLLVEMAEKGLMSVDNIKGVRTINVVNTNLDIFEELRTKYAAFKCMKTKSSDNLEETSSVEKIEDIQEFFVLNSLLSPLFKNSPYKTGDPIAITEIRESIVSYVKESGLTQPSSQNVVLDPILSDIIMTKQEVMPWSEVINKVIDKMKTCYKIRTSKDRIISGNGSLPLINISTATRSGNKQVTIVNNLERYGINFNEFARHCQHALAASTTINQTRSGVSFQVQGSHKPFICTLLVQRYNIPRKVIPGFVEKTKGKQGRK